MHDKLDDLLKNALTPSEEPSAILNQTILQKAKGEREMRKPFYKTIPVVAALAVAVLGTGGLTAYAAWQYLSASEVAQNVQDVRLADAFKGDDAIRINESQVYGDYKITLLGTISGENLSDYTTEVDGVLQSDMTYAVTSIERTDGTAIPQKDDEAYDLDFLVSPFIKGEDPSKVNIFQMGGGARSFVEDGIEYCLMDCDNLEAFAARGVYLGVLGEGFYNRAAYQYDEKTGEITRNEAYEGVNALFELPLDELKADEKEAEKLLAKWGHKNFSEMENAECTEADLPEENREEAEDFSSWSPEKIMTECTLAADAVKEYPASKFDKLIPVYYEKDGDIIEGEFRPSASFQKNEYGVKCVMVNGGEDENIFFLCERKEDGGFLVSVYCMELN